jgi:hypothetical protein
MDPSVASSLIAAGAALLGAALGFAGSLLAARQAARQAREQPQYERRSEAIHEMHRSLLGLRDDFHLWLITRRSVGEIASEFAGTERARSADSSEREMAREQDEKVEAGLDRMRRLSDQNALLLRRDTRTKLFKLLDRLTKTLRALTSLNPEGEEYGRVAYEANRWFFADFDAELEEVRECFLRDLGVKDPGYTDDPRLREREIQLRREAYDDMERRLREIEQRERSSESSGQTDVSKTPGNRSQGLEGGSEVLPPGAG